MTTCTCNYTTLFVILIMTNKELEIQTTCKAITNRNIMYSCLVLHVYWVLADHLLITKLDYYYTAGL